MIEKTVKFKNSKGQKLIGILSTPHEHGKFPTVIAAHGFTSGKNTKTYIELANKLGKVGISFFRFDFSGIGDSEGKFEDTTITQYLDDLKCAINIVSGLSSTGEIGLFGSSLGGMVSILRTSETEKIKVLVLKSPVSDFHETRKLKYGENGIEEWKRKGFMRRLSKPDMIMNYGFYEDGIKHDVYSATKRITCPVLIIHGDLDEEVPLKHSKKFFDILNCEKSLEIIEGWGHCYDPRHFNKMIELSINWFNRWLK